MLIRAIPNFENYSINTLGEVFSYHKYKHGKKLKPHLNGGGYYMITLYRDKKQYYSTIHRLLGLIFIDNPQNKPCIDHINRDRTDNRLENLRWATYSENNQNKETPGCICKRDYGSYLFIIQINGVSHSRTLKTLEEAEQYQYLYNNNLELPPKKLKGCIFQRNSSYQFSISIKGQNHSKTFKSLEEAEIYQQTFQDKDLELPKKIKGGIRQRNGLYEFRITIKGQTHSKSFKSLEESEQYQQTFQ